MAATVSRNPLSVSLRTFAAQIPCNHWQPAEARSRCDSTWQGVWPLVRPPESLSAAISAADQSGRLTLWASAEFSLLCLAILAGILDTNGSHGLINLSGARLAPNNGGQFLTHSAAQFLTHNAATVCVIQGAHSLLHIVRPWFASHNVATVCFT